MLPLVIVALVKILLVVFVLMTAAAYLVLLERWVASWVQDRLGPNRAGIPLTNIRVFGLGQPFADGVKFIFKAEYTPGHVDKGLYFLAPMTIFIMAIAVFAVIPLGSVLPHIPLLDKWGVHQPIQLVIAPGIDVGMIFVVALGSVAVYGVVLGGWASNNKYSFLGGLRSSAQLIAYELPMGIAILGVVLACGSLNLEEIMRRQAHDGVWNAFTQPLGLAVFFVASFAEAARLPFDLPEAEQELIGGYHTEYFGLKLMMYLVGEYLHMVAASYLIVILFFGGWHLWGVTGWDNDVGWLQAILRIVVLNGKALVVIVFFMVARWAWAALPLRPIDVDGLAGDVAGGHGQLRVRCRLAGIRGSDRRARRIAARAVHGDRRLDYPARDVVCRRQDVWRCARQSAPYHSARDQCSGAAIQFMKTTESKIRWVEPPKMGVLGQSYLMIFIKGLTTALRHMFFAKKITLQSPEERHKIVDPVNYRGVHRLNKDDEGRVKCVACFLCATACPAHCIDIVAEESPWPDREKYPKVFNIDELRCIYCGMCEQACPVEAIELTSIYDLTGASREEMIFDKEKLLSVYDRTKDLEPMPSKRVGAEGGHA